MKATQRLLIGGEWQDGEAEGFFRARRLDSLLSQAHARYKGVGIPLRASFGSASYDANSDEADLMRRARAQGQARPPYTHSRHAKRS